MANNSWKIARRSNAQLPLVIALALAVVLLGRAQTDMFDRARMRLTDWMAPMLETLRAPVQGFNRWVASADQLFVVYRENLALKEENARLKQWRNVAVVMQDRVRHYQQILRAVPDLDIHSVLARVIGRANRPFLQTMILNAGQGQSVKAGEAVVDAHGMIGRIYLAGDHTSWVILLTDLNSRIPVAIAGADGKGGGLQAIMTGDNSAMPLLDTLSQVTALHAGDQVVSSGDGGLVPPGLAIGTVTGGPGAWRVALLADPASSEDVEVLGFRKPIESLPPISLKQLPAVAAGLPPAAPPVTAPVAAPADAAKPAPPPAAPKPAPVPASPLSAQNPGGNVSARAQFPEGRE